MDAARLKRWLTDAHATPPTRDAPIAWLAGTEARAVAEAAAAAAVDFDVVVVTPTDPRQKLLVTMGTASLVGRRLVVLDDFENLHGPDVASVLKAPKHPVVCLSHTSSLGAETDTKSRGKRLGSAVRRCASLEFFDTSSWRPPTTEDMVRDVFGSSIIMTDLETDVLDALFDTHLSFAATLEDCARVAETVSASDRFELHERSAACSLACISKKRPRALRIGTAWSKAQAACATAKSLRVAASEGRRGVAAPQQALELGKLGFRPLAAATASTRKSQARATRDPPPSRRPPTVVIRRLE